MPRTNRAHTFDVTSPTRFVFTQPRALPVNDGDPGSTEMYEMHANRVEVCAFISQPRNFDECSAVPADLTPDETTSRTCFRGGCEMRYGSKNHCEAEEAVK